MLQLASHELAHPLLVGLSGLLVTLEFETGDEGPERVPQLMANDRQESVILPVQMLEFRRPLSLTFFRFS